VRKPKMPANIITAEIIRIYSICIIAFFFNVYGQSAILPRYMPGRCPCRQTRRRKTCRRRFCNSARCQRLNKNKAK
jgi:hypothetical protein